MKQNNEHLPYEVEAANILACMSHSLFQQPKKHNSKEKDSIIYIDLMLGGSSDSDVVEVLSQSSISYSGKRHASRKESVSQTNIQVCSSRISHNTKKPKTPKGINPAASKKIKQKVKRGKYKNSKKEKILDTVIVSLAANSEIGNSSDLGYISIFESKNKARLPVYEVTQIDDFYFESSKYRF